MITKQMKDMTPEERSSHMKSLRAKVKNPGFANMSKEKRREIAALGGRARWNEKNNPPKTDSVQDETKETQTPQDA